MIYGALKTIATGWTVVALFMSLFTVVWLVE